LYFKFFLLLALLIELSGSFLVALTYDGHVGWVIVKSTTRSLSSFPISGKRGRSPRLISEAALFNNSTSALSMEA
jgi:hypothetical protein